MELEEAMGGVKGAHRGHKTTIGKCKEKITSSEQRNQLEQFNRQINSKIGTSIKPKANFFHLIRIINIKIINNKK